MKTIFTVSKYAKKTVYLLLKTEVLVRSCGYARNRAIALSSGEFICSADADDIMLPRRVERQLALAVAHPQAIVGCRFVREPHDAAWHYSLWANCMSQQQLRSQQFRECTIPQPTWFYSRATYLRAGALRCYQCSCFQFYFIFGYLDPDIFPG